MGPNYNIAEYKAELDAIPEYPDLDTCRCGRLPWSHEPTQECAEGPPEEA